MAQLVTEMSKDPRRSEPGEVNEWISRPCYRNILPMHFRYLFFLQYPPYTGSSGLPRRFRAGRKSCLGAFAESENRTWCRPKEECGLGFVPGSLELLFFSWLRSLG